MALLVENKVDNDYTISEVSHFSLTGKDVSLKVVDLGVCWVIVYSIVDFVEGIQ